MRWSLTRSETWLAAACATLLLAAWLGPVLPEPAHAHDFADQRGWWGIPHVFDVLSNLPFALAGWAGLRALAALPGPGLPHAQRRLAGLFFVGLCITAAGSAGYHWQPDAAGLALDRMGMGVAFAGLLGLMAACQVSARAGAGLALAILVAAPTGALVAWMHGNVLPWAGVQFGGIGLALALACRQPRPGALPVRWAWVLAAYAVAKMFEMGDHVVFEATGAWFGGHALKHVAAACAAVPVLLALRSRQNQPTLPPGTLAAPAGRA